MIYVEPQIDPEYLTMSKLWDPKRLSDFNFVLNSLRGFEKLKAKFKFRISE